MLRLLGLARPPALAPLDLTVARGELVVLLGPSGAGKSTALRLVAGYEQPSSGRVVLAGRDITTTAPAQRDLAAVFAGQPLVAHLTVYENLAFALRVRRLDERELAPRIEAAARSFGLERLLDRRPAQLSSGERTRVALGRAMARAPAVLLFDEPLAGLDVESRAELRAAIRRVHRASGAATIYATCDPLDAATLADRIVPLRAGEVGQEELPGVLEAKDVDPAPVGDGRGARRLRA